ncbi:hypothetical protein, partial [Succinimonas sp.]|uniref:hypothetical protein n=1 Tax=Succinimonas sp. TaxID=1936151 RepID=UPI003869EC55
MTRGMIGGDEQKRMNKRDGQMMKMRRAFFSAAKVKYELKSAPEFWPVSCLCRSVIFWIGA